ncbi:MAG: tetratricopeptide repeat protein [Cyclobacteriaceae bacterium]
MSEISEILKEGAELAGNGHFQEAVDKYKAGLKKDPKNAELLYNQAKAYFKLKDFGKAVSNFDTILTGDSNNADIISERAVLFHHMGDNKKALAELDRAAALEPGNPFRYSSRAWIKAALKDIEGAIADYDKAIQLDPEDAIAYNNKGLLEDQLGYRQSAKKSFDKSNELTGYQPQFQSEEEKRDKEMDDNAKPAASVEDQNDKLTATGYTKTLKGIFTDKSERKQFFSFLKNLGKSVE